MEELCITRGSGWLVQRVRSESDINTVEADTRELYRRRGGNYNLQSTNCGPQLYKPRVPQLHEPGTVFTRSTQSLNDFQLYSWRLDRSSQREPYLLSGNYWLDKLAYETTVQFQQSTPSLSGRHPRLAYIRSDWTNDVRYERGNEKTPWRPQGTLDTCAQAA